MCELGFCWAWMLADNQPTIPQVYLNCKFMGEVVTFFSRCTRTGELVEELKKLGICSALLDETEDQDSK